MDVIENPVHAASAGSAARDGESEVYAIDRLRDGTKIRVRRVTLRDQRALLRFMEQLTPESRRMRSFSSADDLPAAARWAARADGADHLGMVATDDRGKILAHAACLRMYGARAEVAIEIEEIYRHQGLATILIARLAREAEKKQIRHFVDGEADIEFPTSVWQLPPDRFGHSRPDTGRDRQASDRRSFTQ